MEREPLLGRHHLPDATTVSLRHPHRRDRAGVRELLERSGIVIGELEVARALRFDPQCRAVIVATTWVSSAQRTEAASRFVASAWTPTGERIVGVAGIDLLADAEPDLLVTDGSVDEALTTLMAGALVARAAAHARRVA